MRKILTIALTVALVVGGVGVRAEENHNLDIRLQLLDNEIERLTREKQQRYRELEQCASRVQGFRIAGISLLGLTAVGVGVNIYQYTERGRRTRELAVLKDQVNNLRSSLHECETVDRPRLIEAMRAAADEWQIAYGPEDPEGWFGPCSVPPNGNSHRAPLTPAGQAMQRMIDAAEQQEMERRRARLAWLDMEIAALEHDLRILQNCVLNRVPFNECRLRLQRNHE
jgi:hypothetical protein